ncbi:MAG: outer membrane protein transport protein [Ketobacteraceae bacterium]|nr:outer membrane protein transport protein [Ketobacteraceae bacterium]
MLKRLLVGSAAALLFSGTSHAQMGQNLFIGNAKALGLGNAVTADPPGIDAIHFNPAGLVKMKGRKKHLKFILGNADISADFSDGMINGKTYGELIEPTGSDDPTRNSTSEIESFAVYLPGLGITEVPVIAAPVGGMSYNPPGSDVTFATAAYAPLILGYTRSDDDPGVFYGRELGLARITYLSPTIGWQLSESLSVGAGIGFSYMGVGLNLDYRATNYFIGAAESLVNGYCSGIEGQDSLLSGICEEDASISPFERVFTLEVELEETFSPTFNFGVLWEPTSWFSWGLVYQSEAADTLEGDLTVAINPELVNFIEGIAGPGAPFNPVIRLLFPGINQELFIDGGNIQRTGSIDIYMPQHIATGISLRVFPSLKINLDYKWTETSKWEELDFRFDTPIQTLALLNFIDGVSGDALTVPREYEDASNWALGIEYQYNDQVALRLGYEPRKSGIPDDKRDFLLPLGDFDLWGAGFEYRISPDQIFDFAVGYGKIDETVRTGESTNGNDVRPDNFVYNPSAGQDVHYTTEFLLFEFSYISEF